MSKKELKRLALIFDLDGVTWPDDCWPDIANEDTEMISLIARLCMCDMVDVIINTCRMGDALCGAVDVLYMCGVSKIYMNKNTPERRAFYGSDPSKPSGDRYYDDRAYGYHRDGVVAELKDVLAIAALTPADELRVRVLEYFAERTADNG